MLSFLLPWRPAQEKASLGPSDCQSRQVGSQVCEQEEERIGMLRGLGSWIQHLILSIQPRWCGLASRALGIKHSKSSHKVIDSFLELQ